MTVAASTAGASLAQVTATFTAQAAKILLLALDAGRVGVCPARREGPEKVTYLRLQHTSTRSLQ